MRGVFACLIIFFLLFPLPGGRAADKGGDDSGIDWRGEVVIGATFPLTGEFENYGQSAYYGAVTRVKMINADGGINGKRLVVEWRDNRSDPAQSERDVEELVSQYRVPAILGPLLSESAMRVRDTAKRLGVVVMTPMGTADALTRDNPWMFRATFNNTVQAEGLINFQMNSYGATTCGIVFDPRHSFSVELADIFEKMFTERGGRVICRLPIAMPDGTRNFDAPLTLLAKSKADFLFAPCYALTAIELVHAARKNNIDIRLVGSDTWDNELVFDGAGQRLSGTSFASALFEQAFNYRPFRVFFAAMEQAGMDNPDAQAACAYDAVSLLAEGLKNGETPEKIREGLLAVKRLSLATGRVTVTPGGDVMKPVIIRVVEQRGGRLVPVYAERSDP